MLLRARPNAHSQQRTGKGQLASNRLLKPGKSMHSGKKAAIVARKLEICLPLFCGLGPGGQEIATIDAAREEFTSPVAAHSVTSISLVTKRPRSTLSSRLQSDMRPVANLAGWTEYSHSGGVWTEPARGNAANRTASASQGVFPIWKLVPTNRLILQVFRNSKPSGVSPRKRQVYLTPLFSLPSLSVIMNKGTRLRDSRLGPHKSNRRPRKHHPACHMLPIRRPTRTISGQDLSPAKRPFNCIRSGWKPAKNRGRAQRQSYRLIEFIGRKTLLGHTRTRDRTMASP